MVIDNQTEYLRYKIEINYSKQVDIRDEMFKQYGNELVGDYPWTYENYCVYCSTEEQALYVELLVV